MASKRITTPGRGATLSLKHAAGRVGVTPATLRRWARCGVIPQYDDAWTAEAVAHARIVAAMRRRGHSLAAIRVATQQGRLAFGLIEAIFPRDEDMVPREQAAAQTGLEPELIERIVTTLGWSFAQAERLSVVEVQLLRYLAAVLEAGLPLAAMLQLMRVYGQAIARVADAEVRLFHLYVHEPLLRSGESGIEMGDEMRALTRELLPLASPVMECVHQRYLQHFVEQDVVAHMESDLDGELDLGRLRVAIAFADLAGYTRLTEKEGDLEALGAVERFVDSVQTTLPERGSRDQDDRRRGDDRRLGRRRADRLGGRVSADAVTTAAAADRDPLRCRAVSRRRLLRTRCEHRVARRSACRWRRGARHAPRGRAGWDAAALRANRRRAAEGVQPLDGDVPRAREP